MGLEQDWMIRQINALMQFVSRVFFKGDVVSYEIIDEIHLNETDIIHNKLLALIGENRIDDAEDYLFENCKTDDDETIKLAIDFYQRLNGLSDAALEAGNFSREEIDEGLRDVLKKLHIHTGNM